MINAKKTPRHEDHEKEDEFNLNNLILKRMKEPASTIDSDRYAYLNSSRVIQSLKNIEQGGFDHQDMSDLYTFYQADPRYKTTRYSGWRSLFELAIHHTQGSSTTKTPVILDFLAGSGTLSKRAKAIWRHNPPSVFGIDVSRAMVEQAINEGEIVFWSDALHTPFKEGCADIAIAAYGLHHVPLEVRHTLVKEAHRTLRKGGVCLLHDFLEGTPSAKFYSDLIDTYRPYGHPYAHFSLPELTGYFQGIFETHGVNFLYDPFYLEALPSQDETALKRDFFSYIIAMFNLPKILPNNVTFSTLTQYTDESYWKMIENVIGACFKITDVEASNLHVSNEISLHLNTYSAPYVSSLKVIRSDDGKLALIAPRAALVGYGRK